MGNIRQPRSGSMQYWPRKRAKKETPTVKAWASSKDANLLGFAGYKVGMSHIIFRDTSAKAAKGGEDKFMPVTVVECPPIRLFSVRFHKSARTGSQVVAEVALKPEKYVKRRVNVAKGEQDPAAAIGAIKPESYSDISVLAYTQPHLIGFGKKTPDVFEIFIGGNKEQKLAFVKEYLDKEISVEKVFKEGAQVDIHSVTKGKGYQGPVKRFGIRVRSHKAEKTKRGPGSLGGWRGQAHMMYRVAHAGQMGYHTRTEYNKWLVKISPKPEEINPKGGIIRYGNVKSSFILLKGSVGGAKKRLIRFNVATRPNRKITTQAPQIKQISLESHQGR